MDMEETSREVLWMRQRYLEMFGRRRGTSGDVGERRRDVLECGGDNRGHGGHAAHAWGRVRDVWRCVGNVWGCVGDVWGRVGDVWDSGDVWETSGDV